MSTLDQPLSSWERFRARCLGAVPQCRRVPKDKKTVMYWVGNIIKWSWISLVCTPLLPTVIVGVAFLMGFVPPKHVGSIWLLGAMDIMVLLGIGVGCKITLNSLGLICGAVGAVLALCFVTADNVYQNICQKVFNKNFKNYPSQQRIQQ